MSNFKPALKTARTLLASGLRGSELTKALNISLPVLSSMEQDRLKKAIRREYNILGQAAHDPNLYRSCHAAKESKEKNPNKDLIIATYQTPMCSTCDHNRHGSCSLMGGKLVAGPTSLTPVEVRRTASILVNEGQLSKNEAETIVSNQVASPSSKVAALHSKRVEERRDRKAEIKAVQGSRRAAAILEPDNRGMTLKPKKTLGPRKASNQEGEGIVLDSEVPEQSKMGKLASTLRPRPMKVRVTGAPPRQTSRQASIGPISTFDVPKSERGTRVADSTTEHMAQTQRALEVLAKRASVVLGRGEMTSVIAGKVLTRMSDFMQHGAVHSPRSRRIAGQLSLLCGSLEL